MADKYTSRTGSCKNIKRVNGEKIATTFPVMQKSYNQNDGKSDYSRCVARCEH